MKNNIIVSLLIITGIILLVYPFVSDYIYELNQTKIIENYQSKVEILSEEQKKEKLKKAEKYNDELKKDNNIDVSLEQNKENETKKYFNLLDVGEAMGYISIPKIEINLPIYHGTSADVLKNGVGHLETSALPIGGKGTHAVLAGHTGLAKGKIFDNIDKLEIGDIFYINVLDKVLMYKVDNIVIVSPYDTNAIKVDPSKDYVTLVTCTPKFINTNRLLVRGERYNKIEQKEKTENVSTIENTEQTKQQTIVQNEQENTNHDINYINLISENKKELIILGVIFILIGVLVLSHKFIRIKEDIDTIPKPTKHKFTIKTIKNDEVGEYVKLLLKNKLTKRNAHYKDLKFYVFSNGKNFSDMILKKGNKFYVIHYDSSFGDANYKEMTKYLIKSIYKN